ncbi:flagellar hook-basal body protein [Effusibacillus lacus]|uniref:Flagellar basal-body rod protein FlgF n=1 Tax=Effusibacillus lacus TaxID=1348429 RepID=A0A292YL51_9BACL|nr:flagellar hook-basal body protein [Effusibacillus lacus]TCS71793.1 flagellar basal-body rod protein FlgG [Effusibacillus lacus]GAX89639.1 flagellar basal-body rod protein FlgF [Effusibacillus lacus]
MIRGLYTAASGMLAGERRQEVLSNNLANVNTVGYKKDDSVMRSFPEMLLYSLNDHTGSGPQRLDPNSPSVGAVGTGAFLEEIITRFTPGTLKPTKNQFGFAIVDSSANPLQRSFFPMADQEGNTFLTRDGDFHPDSQGFLVNGAGFYLQAVGTDGKPVANSRVRVNNEGTPIPGLMENGEFAENAAGLRFDLVHVANVEKLQNVGGGRFRFQEDNLTTDRSGEMRQGFLEGSNVDLAEAMTDMIAVMRNYEANQRVIRVLDSTLDKAVNQLGRLG